MAEIKARQSISAQNGKYKVAKLEEKKDQAAKAAEARAKKLAEAEAKRAKYAAMAGPKAAR